jgi:hypothetical protein
MDFMKIRSTFELLHADRQTDRQTDRGKANTFSFCNFGLRACPPQKKKKSHTTFLKFTFSVAYYFSVRLHSREKRLLAFVVSFRLSDCIGVALPGQISQKIQILLKLGKNIGILHGDRSAKYVSLLDDIKSL